MLATFEGFHLCSFHAAFLPTKIHNVHLLAQHHPLPNTKQQKENSAKNYNEKQ